MKVIAFIEGRPKPQPRITQKVRFLFSHPVAYWEEKDRENAEKAQRGALNNKFEPVKATRYAYRLQRLLDLNNYREKVFETVCRACNGGIYTGQDDNIPKTGLFIFYLFHTAKSWSKKKADSVLWKQHKFKPDWKNCYTAVEDSLYKEDSDVSAIANYKMYVPKTIQEGVLIMQDQEIHQFVIDTAIEVLTNQIKFKQ